MWDDFRLHLVSAPLCRSQCGRQKQKFVARWRSNFFSNFGNFIDSFNPVFHFHFKNIFFFWNRTKIDGFTMFFPWNYFLCARIPSFLENGKQNVKVLWEEFRCHLILWVTMWAEFFSHCDSHCEKIVRKLWVEMNTLIVISSPFPPLLYSMAALSSLLAKLLLPMKLITLFASLFVSY